MLDSLHIKNFRCFEDLTIPSLGRVNLIVGKNNSGKSTLLEAVYLYIKAGKAEAVQELLDKRGDSTINASIDYNAIFYRDTPPSSFEERLEISDEKQRNHLIITDRGDDSQRKVHQLTNSLLDFDFASGLIPIYDPTYTNDQVFSELEISNIRNGNRIKGVIKSNIFYSPAYIENESKLADMWDQIFLNDDDSIIKNSLQIIEKNIVNLSFIPSKNISSKTNNEKRIAIVKIKEQKKAIPIKRLGDGASRLLQIFLYAMQAKNGIILIDEIENGLHYSIQEEVWEKLFKLAKELDIQVFATTHSQDTIKAFSKVALQSEEEGRLISLGRNEREIDKGKITALTYNEDDIKLIAETGMEVR